MDTFNAQLFEEQFIMKFQQHTSLLRETVTTSAIGRGDRAHFLIANVTGDMVTRAADGSIPFDDVQDSQVTCTLQAKFHKDRFTEEQMQEGQANIAEIAAKRATSRVNREWDQTILTELNTVTGASIYNSTAKRVVFEDILEIDASLAADNIPHDDGEKYAVVSPKFWANMLAWDEFTNVDYTGDRRIDKSPNTAKWMGFTWLRHPHVPGIGTADARCFFFHKSAMGHCIPRESQDVRTVPKPEDFLYDIAAKLYHGAKVLQTEGIRMFKHNDTLSVEV